MYAGHRPLAYLLVLSLVVAPVIGCGGGGYDSPDAVFNAATDFAKKENWQGFADTLTTESQEAMAGGLAMAGLFMKAFAGFGGASKDEKTKSAFEDMDKVLSKHGLSEEAMKKMGGEKKKDMSPQEAMAKIAEPIKDKPQFIADMMGVLTKIDPEKQKVPLNEDAKLTDLKVDGDTAKGTVVTKKDGKEQKQPIAFKKTSSGWKIDIMPMMATAMKQGDPDRKTDKKPATPKLNLPKGQPKVDAPKGEDAPQDDAPQDDEPEGDES